MLRRNNSSRLSRRKSASSAHSKHEFIDPEAARRQAQTAATLAFIRAQERRIADIGHRAGGLSLGDTSFQQNREQQSKAGVTSSGKQIKRQQSVRFVGPTATQKRISIGSRAVHPQIVASATVSQEPMVLTTNTSVPAAYRPPSRSSSIGRVAAASRSTAESGGFDEYFTREDDIASTPSSYRRIRRSKSMFSPLKAPNIFYTNGTPEKMGSSHIGHQVSFSNLRAHQDRCSQPLRAPKSMSFLRGGRDHLTATLRERNDTAVQMARDRFFHQAAQQRLREQPSFLFRSKAQRQEKPFRRSVRSNSREDYGVPIASSNQIQAPRESSLKDVARKASRTIKSTLRRVFVRSKEDSLEIPNQQVDAPETHVRQYLGDSTIQKDEFSDVPHPSHTNLTRVASRAPSLHSENSYQHLKSQNGSVRSFKSDHSDEKSRVTSWNSSGVNTITSQTARVQAEREQQRLSIINENGTHVSKSSFKRPRLTTQYSAYPLIHRSNKSDGHQIPSENGHVDSARVYSALMKRLDENSPKAKLGAARKISMESSSAAKQPVASDNFVTKSPGHSSPATIRQITEAESKSDREMRLGSRNLGRIATLRSPKHSQARHSFELSEGCDRKMTADKLLHQHRMRNSDDVFCSRGDVYQKENIRINQNINCQKSNISRVSSTRPRSDAPNSFGLTPQELAVQNEPVIPNTKVLREARSTFFGGSSFITSGRSPSPYRRALAESSEHSAIDSGLGIKPQTHTSSLINPLYLANHGLFSLKPGVDGVQEVQRVYSESTYSRTTSGQTPAATNSAVSLPLGNSQISETRFSEPTNGDVIILDRAVYRPTMLATSTHRVTSSTSSNEWKTWMSSEVAKLEKGKEYMNSAPSYINYALPTMPRSFKSGHVRESAQINDDDVEIAQSKAQIEKQPLGIVQQQNPNIQIGGVLKPILKNRSAVSLVDNVELIKPTSVIPIPPPPPVPVRSPIRIMPSRSSLRSLDTPVSARTGIGPMSATQVSSLSGRNVLHRRHTSQSTLRSFKSTKSAETPAKLVKRIGRPVLSNKSSPGGGLLAAIEKQFGSTTTSTNSRASASRGQIISNENMKLVENDELYGSEGTGLMGPVRALDAQAMGSKRMVEMFLSSRRRRITSGTASEGYEAFI